MPRQEVSLRLMLLESIFGQQDTHILKWREMKQSQRSNDTQSATVLRITKIPRLTIFHSLCLSLSLPPLPLSHSLSVCVCFSEQSNIDFSEFPGKYLISLSHNQCQVKGIQAPGRQPLKGNQTSSNIKFDIGRLTNVLSRPSLPGWAARRKAHAWTKHWMPWHNVLSQRADTNMPSANSP